MSRTDLLVDHGGLHRTILSLARSQQSGKIFYKNTQELARTMPLFKANLSKGPH